MTSEHGLEDESSSISERPTDTEGQGGSVLGVFQELQGG